MFIFFLFIIQIRGMTEFQQKQQHILYFVTSRKFSLSMILRGQKHSLKKVPFCF